LFINEAMSINSATIQDDSNEFDDWLEIYNATGSTISLTGKYLSDRSEHWNKFPLPDIFLPAHAFILIWLDNDPEQGPMHANFKINSAETIYLVNVENGESRLVDQMTGLPTEPDISLELATDGGPISQFTSDPTPGYSNNDLSISAVEPHDFYAFP